MAIFCHGYSGVLVGCRGSGGSVLSFSQVAEAPTTSSIFFKSPGHQTQLRAKALHLTTPWWPWWSLCNISSCSSAGITRRLWNSSRPYWTVNSWRTNQYCRWLTSFFAASGLWSNTKIHDLAADFVRALLLSNLFQPCVTCGNAVSDRTDESVWDKVFH